MSTEHTTSWVALRYRDLRWMIGAQFISTTGNFMQFAAVNWHVYALTKDPLALGLVGLVRVVPIIVLSLVGGVFADALDRRRLMIRTESAMLVVASLLALFTLTGNASLFLIYLFTAVLGGINAFDRPAWSGVLPNLVPRDQMSNAIRLNSVSFQLSAVVGPVLAGLILSVSSPGGAYLINAISFIPVVWVLLKVRLPQSENTVEKRAISFAAVREGLDFIRRTPLMWSSMILDFFATFFSSALALLPIYASDILKVGESGYGFLFAAPNIGAMIGALTLAHWGARFKRQGEAMLGAVAVYGLATIVFGLSEAFWLSALALFITGLADSISVVVRNTLRQLLTPDRLRGRMQSINMIFFMGGPQLGEVEAGLVARLTTPAISVVTGGVGTLIVVAVLAYGVPILRRYRELPSAVEAR